MIRPFVYDNRVSVEFFPPRDNAGIERLRDHSQRLFDEVKPSYASVTYGAGGTTQQSTHDTLEVLSEISYEVVPHISCIGVRPDDIRRMLDEYQARGVRRLVALRGDLPSGMGGLENNELRYAVDLVKLIRKHYGDAFHISVAAYPETHPQAVSSAKDLDYFIEKVEAGADNAITQYFYNADAYFDFMDRLHARNVTIPVVAGIMPINNFAQIARFSQMCGAEIPRWLRHRFENHESDMDGLREFAKEVVVDLGVRLLEDGAPGLHFYTLNQAGPVIDIWTEIKKRVPHNQFAE